MDGWVFAAVLLAAACHAGWNASIKRTLDPLVATTAIAIGAGLIALPVLLVSGLPAAPSWPWAFASVVIHLFYFAGLIESYRAGDMSQVYPIARGAAPLATALILSVSGWETIGLYGWGGVILLASGVLLLSLRGGRTGAINSRAVGFALFTALTICIYSVVDGTGVRAAGAGQAHAYIAMLFVGMAPVMAAYALVRGGAAVRPMLMAQGRLMLGGGLMAVVSYGIAIWAMTVAPIALVAALRETSVLFGTVIALVILKEPPSGVRLGSAALVLLGLVLIRLA